MTRWNLTTMAALLFLFASGPATGSLAAQSPTEKSKAPKVDRRKQFRPLVGVWEGASEGKPGKGTVRLEISFVLGEKYLKVATVANYKNAKGTEQHEDFGYVSFDSARKAYVFRQFHGEGFVNQYLLANGDPKTTTLFEFTSESCENTPSKWKARERYALKENGTLEHIFELAPPNGEFEAYSRAKLTRLKE